jgi:hypothetical protein
MRNRKALLAAVCAIGIAGISTIAYAYAEKTDVARLTWPPLSGCFQQETGLIHGGATDPITLVLSAWMPGRTQLTSQQCNTDWPAGSGSWLVAQPAEYLIKLIDSNNPALGYLVCDTPTIQQQILVPRMDINITYATPPCGPGYYALVSCFNSLTSYTSTPSGVVIGSYAASPFFKARDCNYSPNYHPVGVGDMNQRGPQVVIF